MAKTTPKVQGKRLYLDGSNTPTCRVGSADWFTWLETATTFRYFTDQQTRVASGYARAMYPISVRKEKRRRQFIWYAYRRSNGQLYKQYVGKTAMLTVGRLDEIAAWMDAVW
jgi:LuxR family maltose regulon positive regulatory protein